MFGKTHGLRCFVITVNANGVHVPNGGADGQSADWLHRVQGFHDRTTGIGNSTGVEEIGENKKLRHPHFLVDADEGHARPPEQLRQVDPDRAGHGCGSWSRSRLWPLDRQDLSVLSPILGPRPVGHRPG